MKHLLSLFSVFLLICISAQRTEMDFNDHWQFLKKQNLENADAPDWKNVKIPHIWNLDAYEKRDYERNQFWYQKLFDIPENLKNKELFLRFEAVNSYAEVYLNGNLLTKHSGGYSAFHVKLPKEFLKEKQNRITVKADNRNINIPPLSGDFTIFGGMYRNVKLIAVEKQHFSLENFGSKGVFISTPEVSEALGMVSVKGNITNFDTSLQLKISVKNQGTAVFSETFPLSNENFSINTIKINAPKLWSPETPNLYLAEIQLEKNGKIIDELPVSFGFRWFSADTKNGFMLNGKPLKLMGTNRHQDKFPYGIAVPKEIHWEDVKLIKETGANFLRLAHYQQDDEVLKACDSLGLMVWEEIPVVDIISESGLFKLNAENQLKEMVRQHYNHPSVVFWGYMNEPVIQVQYRVEKEKQPEFYQKTVELAKHLEQLLKQEDDSRLSVIAFHGTNLYNEIGMNGIADVTGWNLYQGWYGDRLEDFEKFTDEQNKNYPEQPIIISEFGAGSDKRLHSLKPETFDFSIEYQQKYLEHYLPEIEKRPYIIGATEWNFIDFNVATRQESMPRTNNKGLVYNDRTPKDVYYYFQAFLRKDIPVLHIAADDWKTRSAVTDNEFYSFPVKVYSNQKNIRLIVNGNEVQTKSTDNFNAVFQVKLNKGKNIVEAVSAEHPGISDKKEIVLNLIPETLKNAKNIDIAINAGSNCDFFDEKNKIFWMTDRAYTPGSWGFIGGEIFRKSSDRIGTTAEVVNTANTPLFQIKRENIREYRFDVPKGNYEIELGFADLYNAPQKQAYDLSKNIRQNENLNVFNVYINDVLVLENFCPYEIAGNNSAIIKNFPAKSKKGKIIIRFEKISGASFLNSVRISSEK